jgi:undecaprenyl-diphosphatase
VLFGAELLRRRAAGATSPVPAALPWKTAFAIGMAQASALLPGLSRTGATISGGLLARLSHADAAHFAFLMATPIIFAAAALKLPALFAQGTAETVVPTLVGMLASGIAAFLSVRYLTRYFRVNTLTPFAIYCFLAGLISFAVLLFR